MKTKPKKRNKKVLVSQEMINFLHGVGPLCGCHFGEIPSNERGQFWWRKLLPPFK